jgi:broad specificity phosphatase PhoE
MKVYLIRHAMSQDAEKGLFQRDDSPISKDSIKENYYKNWKLEKVYCSPMLRAQQTAEELFKDFETIDYIYEYIPPKKLDGKFMDEVRIFWEKHGKKASVDPDWSHDGSESFNTIVKRANKFYKFLQSLKHSRVGVVGHSIFFSHLMSVHALGMENYTIDKYQKLSRFIRPYPLRYLSMDIKTQTNEQN